jgi:uncharacterized protein YmfQ (DUF2313 family)
MTAEATDKYAQAMAAALPTGFAWPRQPDSVLMRVVRGVAGSLAELDDGIHEVVRQWQPATSVARLAEWEEATGLPDACFGLDQSVALRRSLLLRRLRGPVLPLSNSSPAAPGVLVRICADLGYVATVAYNRPARVGVARVGRRLGALDGRLYITVDTGAVPARVGKNRVGDRLVYRAKTGSELECYLKHVVPARYLPVVIFV